MSTDGRFPCLCVVTLSLLLAAGCVGHSRGSNSHGAITGTIEVEANQSEWTDVGLDLAAGDRLSIVATGRIMLGMASSQVGPGGASPLCGQGCPGPSEHLGSLIAKIELPGASPFIFAVGAKLSGIVPVGGRLSLIVNARSYPTNAGLFVVDYAAGAPTCSAASCPNGCCDSLDICNDGSYSSSCGSGGAACVDCQGNGQICGNTKQCVSDDDDDSCTPTWPDMPYNPKANIVSSTFADNPAATTYVATDLYNNDYRTIRIAKFAVAGWTGLLEHNEHFATMLHAAIFPDSYWPWGDGGGPTGYPGNGKPLWAEDYLVTDSNVVISPWNSFAAVTVNSPVELPPGNKWFIFWEDALYSNPDTRWEWNLWADHCYDADWCGTSAMLINPGGGAGLGIGAGWTGVGAVLPSNGSGENFWQGSIWWASDCPDDDDASPAVWTDSTTNLMWQANPPNTYPTQSEAVSYCAGLTLGGYADWRLPDIDDLRSLIRGCPATEPGGACGITDHCLNSGSCAGSCGGCARWRGPDDTGCYRPSGLGGVCFWNWSSDADAASHGADFVVDFESGGVRSMGGAALARCVRGPSDDDDDDDDDTSPADDDDDDDDDDNDDDNDDTAPFFDITFDDYAVGDLPNPPWSVTHAQYSSASVLAWGGDQGNVLELVAYSMSSEMVYARYTFPAPIDRAMELTWEYYPWPPIPKGKSSYNAFFFNVCADGSCPLKLYVDQASGAMEYWDPNNDAYEVCNAFAGYVWATLPPAVVFDPTVNTIHVNCDGGWIDLAFTAAQQPLTYLEIYSGGNFGTNDGGLVEIDNILAVPYLGRKAK